MFTFPCKALLKFPHFYHAWMDGFISYLAISFKLYFAQFWENCNQQRRIDDNSILEKLFHLFINNKIYNDKFPLKITKISFQKQNFSGMRFPNSTFVSPCMDIRFIKQPQHPMYKDKVAPVYYVGPCMHTVNFHHTQQKKKENEEEITQCRRG